MSDLNDPLKDAYIGKVADALAPYADELKAKGFDPASRIAQLKGAGALIEGAIKTQKAAEKAADDALDNVQNVRGNFYKLSTETVSLAEGLVGKGHELTGKLRGLRAELIGNQNPGDADPTHPAA